MESCKAGLIIFLVFIFRGLSSQEILIPEDTNEKLHILFLMQADEFDRSVEKFLNYCAKKKTADLETLQKMCHILMKRGMEAKDPESQLLSLFGAGIAQSSNSLEIIEKGLTSNDVQVQMSALHFLSQYPEDRIDSLLLNAMSSEYLPVRMEAVYIMAQRKHPAAVGQIESLMQKLPYVFRPYFPPLFAISGTAEAMASLKKLLCDPYPMVRVQALISAAGLGRDDLIDFIRTSASHLNIAEQETSAYALGILKDSKSYDRLKTLMQSSDENVKLAACKGLYLLGDRSVKDKIQSMAKRLNLFAIAALSEIEESEELLYHLCGSPYLQVRINAMISLLKKKDPRCVSFLREFFISDAKDMAFQMQYSLGHAHNAIKAVPSATQRLKDPLIDLSLSLSLKELFLREALELPEKAFLELAKIIFENKQNDLVPSLVALLENKQSSNSVNLLKHYTRKAGAPLIRDYCHLALFRLNEGKEHEEYVRKWLLRQNHHEIIKLRPYLPWNVRIENSKYDLDTDEASRLLIDIYLSLASKQDEESIHLVLDAMKRGNAKNRFVLAGLLILACSH